MKAKNLTKFGILAIERMGITSSMVKGPTAVINPSKGEIPANNHKKVLETKVTKEEIKQNVEVLKTVPGGSGW